MKKLLWPCIIILGIALLFGGTIGVSRFFLTSRFDTQIAAMKAKGEPTTIAELLGDPILDDQNAAVSFMKINAEIETGDYQQALKLLEGVQPSWADFASAADWKAAEDALAKVRPLRRLVDEALTRPKCRFEIDASDPLSTLHPQLPTLKSMMRLYSASAIVNARNGRMEEATGDIATLIGVARCLEEEPAMVSHVVRMAFLNTAAKNTLYAASHGRLSEDQARRLFDELGSVSIAESTRRAWRGERAVLLHYAEPENMRRYLCSVSYIATGSPSAANALYGTYSHAALKADLAAFLAYSGTQLDGVDLCYRDAKARGLFDARNDLPFYAVFSRAVGPISPRIIFGRYVIEVGVALAKTVLALQAYKARYGAYPSTLGELETKPGWKLPKDPFSGKHLIYRPQGKGFILYSVGKDMKGDGGRKPPVDRNDDRGDIVWSVEKG